MPHVEIRQQGKKTPQTFHRWSNGNNIAVHHVQRDCVFPSLELFCVQQQETGFPHQLTNKKNKAAPGRSRAQSQKSDSWLIKQCCVCVCWSITLESLNPQIYPPYKHHQKTKHSLPFIVNGQVQTFSGKQKGNTHCQETTKGHQ